MHKVFANRPLDQKWLSAHIHLPGWRGVDGLLIYGILPLIETLRREGQIERYFFIRYAEGGRHVRLRMLLGTRAVERVVRANVTARLQEYLCAHPVEPASEIASRVTDAPANRTLRWVPYVPETERYGGPAGVRLAEQHFQHSSDVVLSFLKSIGGGVGKEHLKYMFGLELAAMLALSAGFDRTNLSTFFADQLGHIRVAESGANEWAEFLFANNGTLRRRVQAMALAYEGRLPTSGGLTADWRRGTSNTCTALAKLLDATGDRWTEVNERLGVSAKYVLVVQSYIHMTLNRLGVWGLAEKTIVTALRDLAAALVPPRPVPVCQTQLQPGEQWRGFVSP